MGNGGAIRIGTPARGRQRDQRQHRLRRRAGRPLRLRPAPRSAARKKLTLVHKTNVLVHAGCHLAAASFERGRRRASRRHRSTICHVDAATIFLVTDPARFDVIVTDNLFGDILTDLAGAVTGGIGLAASGNINPDGAFAPSMFEPVHGSAPDIAGRSRRPTRPPRSSPSRCCSTTSGSPRMPAAGQRRRRGATSTRAAPTQGAPADARRRSAPRSLHASHRRRSLRRRERWPTPRGPR